ncbi:Glutamate--tRNA ligase [Balamuthia mandrillaris]
MWFSLTTGSSRRSSNALARGGTRSFATCPLLLAGKPLSQAPNNMLRRSSWRWSPSANGISHRLRCSCTSSSRWRLYSSSPPSSHYCTSASASDDGGSSPVEQGEERPLHKADGATTVRVRYAPSPTGMMHLGGLRTALYNYLFARKHNGACILRLEDTDQTRQVEGALDNFLKIFDWVGLNFDEGPHVGGNYGPYIQSQRKHLYTKYANLLLENGGAYRCFCTPERLEQLRQNNKQAGEQSVYDRFCLRLPASQIQENLASGMAYTLRLRVPAGFTKFRDIVRRRVSFKNATIDDQVLIKSDGFPTYHLASVVDDHLMGITHVIRGEEWLTSTPKHLMLYKYFGWTPPQFAHIPLLLNPDKTKLSKRQGGASVEEYMEQLYLPEAIVNFVAMLGWSPGEGTQEVFTLPELIQQFSLERVHNSGAIVNKTKLIWFNGKHLRTRMEQNMPSILGTVRQILKAEVPDIDNFPEASIIDVLELFKDRLERLQDIVPEGLFFFKRPDLSTPEAVAIREKIWGSATTNIEDLLQVFMERLRSVDSEEGMQANNLALLIQEVSSNANQEPSTKTLLFHSLRFVLTGKDSGPSLAHTINILGKQETLDRLSLFLRQTKC